jgi:putative membrane-bound dehydrogenase-like protein
VRLRDLDGDGRCELIVGNPRAGGVFAWSAKKNTWEKLPFTLPAGTSVVDAEGRDRGLRFVDIDDDGHDDVLVSNEDGYSLHLFTSLEKGWSRQALAGKRTDKDAVPMIASKGSNNGAWFHSRVLWVQNEHTAILKDLVQRRAFNDMLVNIDPGPRSPQASLRALKARPGFVVELMAAEPLVQSPIAFAFGPDGKLWVVEMGDYPLGVDGKGKPGGRIKILEDTKGTGKYDKATIFLDKLPFPTGVAPWRKGALITCAPDILYAEDLDGDGKADRKLTLFTGFVEGNQQHRVNSLAWGLDNWIYCANGDSGGRIRSLKTGKVVNISGRDLRIRPDTGEHDAQTGMTQYGRSRDDWGSWFGNNNSNPFWHFVLADHYVRRNPHLAPPDLRVSVPAVPGTAPVFPRSRTLPRFNDPHTANRFTSACSPIVYRDELFGPAFTNNTFVSEPVHNLVHREIMAPLGVTFRSQRAVDERTSEFLASTDNWFRPTMIQTGPDGALWVADMYRAVIEHPQWIPLSWQKKLDLRAGHDKGRIYRIYPVGAKPRAIPRLDKLDTAGLVAALDSPSGWQRDMAHQMLLWRGDRLRKLPGAVPLLTKLARESKRPLARLHALCVLDGLGGLSPDLLMASLHDTHPGVRRHAVRLCEEHLGKSPKLGNALLERLEDDDAQVRLQLACTLGEWDDRRAGRALGQLALRDGGDRYMLAAILSSVNKKNLDQMLLAVTRGEPGMSTSATRNILIDRLLRLASSLKADRATVTLLLAVGKAEKGKYAGWQVDALANLLEGLEQRGSSLARLRDTGGKEMKSAIGQVDKLFTAARATAQDRKAAEAERLRALRLLGRGLDRQAEDRALLAGLLVPREAQAVQLAAVGALARLGDRDVPELLLRGWRGHGPAVRVRVMDTLLERPAWPMDLLKAIERKQVLAHEIDAIRRQRLLEHRDERIKTRAVKVLAGAIDRDRQKVIDAYRPALKKKGDPGRGKMLFAKSCASCHKFGGMGHEVGPDLAPLADRPGEYLLIAILDPNRAVESRYINYLAQTKAGRSFTGVLAAETSTSITLLGPDGKTQVLLRANLDSLTSSGKSAMPEGLEKDLKVQDLADLLAYLRSGRPPVKPKAPGASTGHRSVPGAEQPTTRISCCSSLSPEECHERLLATVRRPVRQPDCAGNTGRAGFCPSGPPLHPHRERLSTEAAERAPPA